MEIETIFFTSVSIILLFIITNQAWQKLILKATINRQKEIIEAQRETIANQNGTIDAHKSILARGVTFEGKPYWLNSDLIIQIRELWNAENMNNTNPRVKASKIIQEKSLSLDKRKLTLQESVDIIKKHCL